MALKKTSNLMTLQGLRPAALAPQIAIMLYYPDRDFPVLQWNRTRPRPQRGQGLRKGAQIFEKGFRQPNEWQFFSLMNDQAMGFLPNI